MNEKFFDLKKEKQDRMINAALKVFALHGYEHASTDEIVKEAGISKGLLFHYFNSKLGLYDFIYDYSVKYVLLELSTGVSKTETDYFELLWQSKASEIQVMNTYPYMLLFLNKSEEESCREAKEAVEEKRKLFSERRKQLLKNADFAGLRKEVEKESLFKILDFTLKGLLEEQFEKERFLPERYGEEVRKYLNMIKGMSLQDERHAGSSGIQAVF